MASEQILTSLKASAFVQASIEPPQWMGGCVEFDDIADPQDTIAYELCRDRIIGGVVRRGVIVTPSTDGVTTTITDVIGETLSLLETLRCPPTFYIGRYRDGANADQLSEAIRVDILVRAILGGSTLGAVLSRATATVSTIARPVSAQRRLTIVALETERQAVAETQRFNFIASCNSPQCATDTQIAKGVCEDMLAAGNAATGEPAQVWLTDTAGGDWQPTDAQPFGDDEHILIGECFSYQGRTRYMVARGVTDAGDPAEIAYSDDNGATWVNVDVGSTNGQFITAMAAADNALIYVGTNDGYIYRSKDAGLTWDVVDAATLTTGRYYSLRFSKVDRGALYGAAAGGVVVRTANADAPTAAGVNLIETVNPSGSNNISLAVVNRYHAAVGTAAGRVYRTMDGGETWAQLGFSGAGTGNVAWIDTLPDSDGQVFALIHNDGTGMGRVHRSFTRGALWSVLDTPTNLGLNAGHICGVNDIMAVGNAYLGTAAILRSSPALAA